MNTSLVEQKVALLKRKFDYFNNTLRETLLTDLTHFLEFIQKDEVIAETLIRIKKRDEKTALTFSKYFHDEHQFLCETAKTLQCLKPDCADIDNYIGKPNALGCNLDEMMVPRTLDNRFNDRLFLPHYFESGAILYGLRSRVGYQKNSNENYPNDNLNGIRASLDKHISLHHLFCESWKQYYSASAVTALKDLEYLISCAFPRYKSIDVLRLLSHEELDILCNKIALGFDRPREDGEWIHDIFHEQADSKRKVKLIKRKVERVFETLLQEVGATRLKWQMLNNYQVRSEKYNRDHLKALSKTGKRKSEELLSMDLGLYLFDQGITVWYRVKRGNVEYDFVHPDTKNPLLIEVKVYRNESSAKSYILKGFKQIHSYLSRIESESNISEGYYVIFRLGGAFFEIPSEISTPKFTIYTVFIDLADSLISGSRQNENKQITVAEIQEQLGVNSR